MLTHNLSRHRYAWQTVSNLDRRSGYTPRRAREQRAYRMVVVGGTAAAISVVTFVLAALTAFPGTIWFIALIVAVICAFGFLRATGQR